MQVCSGCGFQNRSDRDTCMKCGSLFRERKDITPLLRNIGAGLVALLLIGGVLLRIFGPSKMEARMKARAADPAIAAPPSDPTPPARPPETEEDSPRSRGEERLRRADQLFAQGDYPGAAEAYRQAEQLGVRTEESRDRRKVCADIAYIVMYRDYLDRENLLEPERMVAAKSNLGLIIPTQLPSDAWREEYRKTTARVDKAYKEVVGEGTPSSSQETPAPSKR